MAAALLLRSQMHNYEDTYKQFSFKFLYLAN